MSSDSAKFKQRIIADRQAAEEKKKAYASAGGPLGKLFIFLIQNVFYDIFIKLFYNSIIDILSSAFSFVDEMFFSDFKGILAGRFKSKKGVCMEYSYFRYFMTIMIPPMGVFLARGLSAWFNIGICAFLSLINYYPGLIYAIIVIQTAPYANRYQGMKREKLKKARESVGKKSDSDVTPLFMIGLTILLVCVFMLISLGIDPNQGTINGFNNVILYLNSGSVPLRPQQIRV
jgi:uncharacterized membrane protein YqaE (UPF0057 family)